MYILVCKNVPICRGKGNKKSDHLPLSTDDFFQTVVYIRELYDEPISILANAAACIPMLDFFFQLE